jgi:hypothetical protein
MGKRLDDVFDDDEVIDQRRIRRTTTDDFSRPPKGSFAWGSHLLFICAGLLFIAVFVIASVMSAKARLDAPQPKKVATAVAAPSDLGFCT